MTLRQILTEAFSANPRPQEIRAAVAYLQQIASVFLLHKPPAGSFRLTCTGLTIDDLALDCVAPLFERNSAGEFHRLQTYFAGVSWETLAEEELLSQTRRLVFSSVNQGLVRIWKQADPSLNKLLRNLAAAIRKSGKMEIVSHAGHDFVLADCPDKIQGSREEMSQEYLEAMLSPRIREGISMREVVDTVAEILNEQIFYRKSFPLIGLAIAVRTVFTRLTVPLEEPGRSPDEQLEVLEIASEIRRSVSRIRERMEGTYVRKGKTDAATYAVYFDVIVRLLLARYAERNGEGFSLFTCMADRDPGLTSEIYRGRHRAIVEYLFKLSEREFLSSIKSEI